MSKATTGKVGPWARRAAKAPAELPVWAGDGRHLQLNDLLGCRHAAEGLDLYSRHRSHGTLGGAQVSGFIGRGMDFAEVRNYQAGDDIRHIDWRVTARTGQTHTKLFTEERERPVLMLVDLGGSMFFGSRGAFKSVVALRTAALLGWAALRHGDRIGALVGGSHGHREFKPASGRRHWLHILGSLLRMSETALAGDALAPLPQMLKRARYAVRPGSLLCIVSDFQAMDENASQSIVQLAQHNAVLLVAVADPLEQVLPESHWLNFSDGQQRRRINTAQAKVRQQFSEQARQHRARLEALTRYPGVRLQWLSTQNDPLNTLQATFPARWSTAAAVAHS